MRNEETRGKLQNKQSLIHNPKRGYTRQGDTHRKHNIDNQYQGPVSERRLSENSEYVNPEMRETLGFPFQNGRFVKPGKAG